jgi:hypothetical protein
MTLRECSSLRDLSLTGIRNSLLQPILSSPMLSGLMSLALTEVHHAETASLEESGSVDNLDDDQKDSNNSNADRESSKSSSESSRSSDSDDDEDEHKHPTDWKRIFSNLICLKSLSFTRVFGIDTVLEALLVHAPPMLRSLTLDPDKFYVSEKFRTTIPSALVLSELIRKYDHIQFTLVLRSMKEDSEQPDAAKTAALRLHEFAALVLTHPDQVKTI